MMTRVKLLAGSLVGILIVLALTLGPPLLAKSSAPTTDRECAPQTFYLGDQLIDINKLNITLQDKKKALNLINKINKQQNALVLLTLKENRVPQVNLLLLPGLPDDEYDSIVSIAYQLSDIIHGTVNIIDLRTSKFTPIDNESQYINITDKIYNYIKQKNSNIVDLSISINTDKGILIITAILPKYVMINSSIINTLLQDISDAYINLINDCDRPILIVTVKESTTYIEIENINSTASLEPVETLPSPTPPAPQEIGPPLILPVALALAAGLLLALFRIV